MSECKDCDRLKHLIRTMVSDFSLWQCKCGYFSMRGWVCLHCGYDPTDDNPPRRFRREETLHDIR